ADESGRIGVLGHGYTGGAHPVGAAVALENLKIIEERDLVANAAERGAELQAGLAKFTGHPLVGEARGVGLIAALEIVAPEGRAEEFAPGKLGAGLGAHFLKNGLISRNMTDAMAFCPPMIITPTQVTEILSAVEKSLDAFQAELAA
ncbi:aminotransferase class III-fold pyridoxal phosphate-dependent enzyme, partial [Marivita sp. MB-28]